MKEIINPQSLNQTAKNTFINHFTINNGVVSQNTQRRDTANSANSNITPNFRKAPQAPAKMGNRVIMSARVGNTGQQSFDKAGNGSTQKYLEYLNKPLIGDQANNKYSPHDPAQYNQ